MEALCEITANLHFKGYKTDSAIAVINRILATFDRKLEVMLLLFQVKLKHFKANGNVLLERAQWLELNQDAHTVFELFRKPAQPLSEVRTFIRNDATEQEYYEGRTAIDNLRLIFEQLQGQLKKALIYTEFSSPEYAHRLQDLIGLIQFNYELRDYFRGQQA